MHQDAQATLKSLATKSLTGLTKFADAKLHVRHRVTECERLPHWVEWIIDNHLRESDPQAALQQRHSIEEKSKGLAISKRVCDISITKPEIQCGAPYRSSAVNGGTPSP